MVLIKSFLDEIMRFSLVRIVMPKNDQVYHCNSNFNLNDTGNTTLLNVFFLVSVD